MKNPARLWVFLAALLAVLTGCKLFRPYTLTVEAVPSAGGTYTLTPNRDSFGRGEVVVISAQAADGYGLHGFEVDGAEVQSMEGVFALALEQDTLVTINFWPAFSQSYTGPGSEAYLVEPDGGSGIVYSLELGAAPRDVTFVFTNVGTSTQTVPTVTRRAGDFGVPPARLEAPRSASVVAGSGKVALRGNPLADAFYEEAARIRRSPGRAVPRIVVTPPGPDQAGVSTATFHYNSTNVPADQIPATCRAVVTNSTTGKTLSVWVANASWGTGDGKLDVNKVNALAAEFMGSSGIDDIYSWDTGVFGDEWAPGHLDPQVDIPDDDTITILLYDIDGDYHGGEPQGGIVGFFYAKDNFTIAQIPFSNERLMFYIDAPMFSYADPATELPWSLQAYWPREVISTLAHEFQHMIHYYQKDIVKNAPNGPVWLNEMCSMVAEDLLSNKIGVPGPRGVDLAAYSDGSAGATSNHNGFLPQYNYNNFTPVAYWPPPTSSLDVLLSSYATNYAFGAYLARNFGGAILFRNIVQNAFTGSAAIEKGLSTSGYGSETFASTLRKWTIASLLSDSQDASTGYVYNTGTWITPSGVYDLGSIDLYNYSYPNTGAQPWVGPFIFAQLPAGIPQPASSSYYYAAATAASGTLTWQIGMDQDLRLEVVVKPAQ